MSADETRVGFDSPRGLQALQVLQRFGEAGQASADMSRRQARRAFASGRIGVLVTMSSVVPYLTKTSAHDFEVLVKPLPLAHAQALIPAAGPVAVLFAKKPERQRRAWRFVQHAIGPSGQAVLASTSGYLPASDSERVMPWYTFPGRNSLKISDLIQDEMQQVTTLQKTPAKALKDIVRFIGPLLARRG
jgi:multiple sugar transport system substrate-binding protein